MSGLPKLRRAVINVVMCWRARGHLGCFQVLTITNTATMHVCVQALLWTSVVISLGQIRRIG